jgi:thiamine biosynthesis protein ThiS
LTALEARANVKRVNLTINGEVHEIPEGLTLAGLVAHLGLTDGPVAIERNRQVVPRREHANVQVEAGDVLEIVHFVGGG